MNNTITANSLDKKRELLCLELQQNRRYLAQKLSTNDETFPRSLTMRLLTQNNTTIPIVDWPQTGIRIYRVISSSFYLMKSIKHNLFSHKDNKQS